jgi:hypothetical protein
MKTLYFKCFVIISAILVCAGCTIFKHNKSSNLTEKDNITFYSKYSYTDSSNVAYFECENFVSDALNNYSIAIINKEYLKVLNCKKEIVINKYDSAVKDTIYTYSNPHNLIQIYRAKQNDFVFTFDITDSIFKLRGNIKAGMTKEAFLQKFHITKPIMNKVQLANLEGSMRLMFYFENNKLQRVKSYIYLD